MKLLLKWFVPSCLLLVSCSSSRLSVHTDYLTRERLASYHVHTPDPTLASPNVGQRLLISWSLPKEEESYEDLHLLISIRFCNHEEAFSTIPIFSRSGTHIYFLSNQDYFNVGGIKTYKVELMSGDNCLETWRHQLWSERLAIGSP